MAVFVLIYRLREFPLSAVTNRFELRRQSKQLLLLYCKICHCSSDVELQNGEQQSFMLLVLVTVIEFEQY